jgi:hypothetical protein
MNAATTSMAIDIQFDLDDKLTYGAVHKAGGDEYITPAFPGVTLSVL